MSYIRKHDCTLKSSLYERPSNISNSANYRTYIRQFVDNLLLKAIYINGVVRSIVVKKYE